MVKLFVHILVVNICHTQSIVAYKHTTLCGQTRYSLEWVQPLEPATNLSQIIVFTCKHYTAQSKRLKEL